MLQNRMCEGNEFNCKNIKQCIDIHLVCNGNNDCKDKSDEDADLCKV